MIGQTVFGGFRLKMVSILPSQLISRSLKGPIVLSKQTQFGRLMRKGSRNSLLGFSFKQRSLQLINSLREIGLAIPCAFFVAKNRRLPCTCASNVRLLWKCGRRSGPGQIIWLRRPAQTRRVLSCGGLLLFRINPRRISAQSPAC